MHSHKTEEPHPRATELLEWLKRPRRPSARYEDVVEVLHANNERTRFLKQLKPSSLVLDAGAGDGSLECFRDWLQPKRSDLKLFAYAGERGERFPKYDAFEVGYWPDQKPEFPGVMFDAVIACHFIEHLADPASFVHWALSRMAAEGRLYIEWPSESSIDLPTRSHFVDSGIPLVISRFHDDTTHLELPDRSRIVNAISAAGGEVEAVGVIHYPWLEEELLAHWQSGNADQYALQAAYWSHTRWSQFVIAGRCGGIGSGDGGGLILVR